MISNKNDTSFSHLSDLIEEAKESYSHIPMNEKCKILAEHEETKDLVTWYGDYAVYEPELGVSNEQIDAAYAKLMKKENSPETEIKNHDFSH